jgi:hypothetical protein
VDAATPGSIVMATNGVYSTGGKIVAGNLMNRVTIDKPLLVTSVKGPADTLIAGQWDPVTTNGASAIRCAWLGTGAILSGFTLQRGATAATGDPTTLQCGGGVWGASDSTVANSVIQSNAAGFRGGGVYGAQVKNSQILQNFCVGYGGGAADASIARSLVIGNNSGGGGGGVSGGKLLHCTVINNQSRLSGGGLDTCSATNSIVFNNRSTQFPSGSQYYPITAQFAYTCTTPLVSGPGNISVDPQLLEHGNISVLSPCRGAGNPAYRTDVDIDGEAWANPPSMGCDEPLESGLVGPLAVSFYARLSPITQLQSGGLIGSVVGRAARVAWDFGDGSGLTDKSYSAVLHAWTNPGDYTVTFTAYNTDHPEGVTTSLQLKVLPLESPTMSAGSYTDTVFNLSFPGQPGVWYNIDFSTNLADALAWTYVGRVYSTGQVVEVPVPRSTNDTRLYRVRVQ